MKIVTILGARPQFIKASILSKLFKSKKGFKEIIIHTGQHYDFTMSDIFFNELKIPKPHYNLGVKSNKHGEMTGKMLIKIEKLLLKIKPDFTIVYGDTNSTLAGALASRKLNIPVIHIEAGLRSFNKQMPEEINRILTDHSSTYLFAPSKIAKNHLSKENIDNKRIFVVGDTMLDVYLSNKRQIISLSKKFKKNISSKYIFATLHRAENTNFKKKLINILENLKRLSTNFKIIFPIHPRTEKILKNLDIFYNYKKSIHFIKPLGYIKTMAMLKNATLLITDSGGMQKEAFYFDIPCLTVREETEWPETVKFGLNKLVSPKKNFIYHNAIKSINLIKNKKKILNVYGFGNASRLILNQIEKLKTNFL
jgi:UDP-GlcNAc3NAcA epimerase